MKANNDWWVWGREIHDEQQMTKIVATLTEKEAVVYKALVSAWIGNGDTCHEIYELHADLKEARKISKLSSHTFSGVVSSLAKKKLYQLMPWIGNSSPHKTVIINGREEKVCSDCGVVFCTEKIYKSEYEKK